MSEFLTDHEQTNPIEPVITTITEVGRTEVYSDGTTQTIQAEIAVGRSRKRVVYRADTVTSKGPRTEVVID